jgi:hypothetical protein
MITASTEKLFSYRGKAGSLQNIVGAVILKQSEDVMYVYLRQLEVRLKHLAKTWQSWVRMHLSNPAKMHNNGTYLVNKTMWPKLRTGKLRNATRKPTVKYDKHTGTFGSGMGGARYNIQMYNLFNRRASRFSNGQDVGDLLDRWAGKPFAGWKQRSQRVLFLAMKKQMLGRTTDNLVDTNALERLLSEA